MDFLRQHKTLYSFVSSVLAVSLVVYGFGFYSVQAAEVSTLPADIDIIVTYDADNINWTYDNKDYSFSRDFPLVLSHGESQLFYNAANCRYLYDYKGSISTLPFTVEADNSGYLCRASYWFSPSENALYIIRDDDRFSSSYYSAVRSYGVSNGRGSFYMVGGSKYVDFCVFRYDFDENTFIYGVDKYLYGNHSFNAFKYYDFNSGIALKDSANYDTYTSLDDTELTCYLPTDLLCIFSNYEISGFYEPDTSKVNTPDYYFNYQYIFYLDGKGYTFIDSAQPLTEVTAQSSYAYLTFADVCNKYIYTSIDGITWDIKTTVDNMYGVNYLRLDYSWFYKKSVVGYVNQYDAELVYTNDDEFGISKFDWKDIHSAISDITLISTEGQNITDIVEQSGYEEFFNAFSASNEFAAFDIFNQWGFVSSGTQTILKEKYNELLWSFYRSLYHQLSNEYRFSYVWDDELKVLRQEKRITLFGLLQNTYFETYNIRSLFETFGNDFMSSFSILNSNLSGLYELDSKLLLAVKDIKIPDYSNSLSDISLKLDKLPSGSGLPSLSAPFDDTAILGQLETLGGLLTEIKNLERPDLQTVVKPIKDGFDDIHGDLNYIKTLLTVNTIDNLFDDENDDNTGIIKYLRNVITTLQSGAIISDSLTVGGDTMSGVKLLNGYVQDIYTRFPVLAPLVLFPPAVALANTIMRKGRA